MFCVLVQNSSHYHATYKTEFIPENTVYLEYSISKNYNTENVPTKMQHKTKKQDGNEVA